MKKISLFLTLLFSVVLSAAAQQVASSPTTIDNLTTGYYVLRVSSDNGNATASYLYSSDKKVYYDAIGFEKKLAGGSIDENTMNYLFYVTNTDGKLNISLWSDHNLSWPNISEASAGTLGIGKKEHPGDQANFTMNDTKGEFTATLTDGAYALSLKSSYLNNKKAADCTGYVILRDKNLVGYNDEHSDTWSSTSTAKAKVQFFAVSNEPRTNSTFTYNLSHNGTVLKSETHTVLFSNAAYPAFTTNWSDYFAAYYISVPASPTGTIKVNETSYTVELSQDTLPFETDKYYYLGTAGDNPVMVSNKDSKSVAYRSKAQAEEYNNIPNDLWYVTGNVFDGFKFYNVTAGSEKPALSSYDVTVEGSGTHIWANQAVLAFEKGNATASPSSLWDIKKSTNGFLIYTHTDGTKTGEEYGRFWSYADNAIMFNNADDAVKEFALYEPEFTFPLVTVAGASYNSVAFPFAAKLADGDKTKMYKGKIVDNVLDAVEVTTGLPAAPTGAVLVNDEAATTATFVAVKEVPAIDNSDFIGTTTSVSVADLSNYLIFGGDASTGEVGFYSAASDLKANRAYLPKPTSNTKGLTIHIGGQPTGIILPTEFAPTATNAPIYDLSGRRVTTTVKGHLYIQNGRKFIAE